tara:strand:- start:1200 stop:1979 length:780 start_codon:yes stop_codon:yes gene_type:complete
MAYLGNSRYYYNPQFSKPFNLVFTNEDIIKQIINYTKPIRKILKGFEKLKDEPDKIIHICLKFYKMDNEKFSYILHKLKRYIDRSICNFNTRQKDIVFHTPHDLTIINKDHKYYEEDDEDTHIYPQDEIILWIKDWFKYLSLTHTYDYMKNLLNGEEDLCGSGIFNGVFEHYGDDTFMYCIECEEYVINSSYGRTDYQYIQDYKCEYAMCDECVWREMAKTDILNKMVKRKLNKFNKKKIKNNKNTIKDWNMNKLKLDY